MSNTEQPEDLRAALKAAHNRFHGRFETHARVARHARWTTYELENVQIEDEEIYYDEILRLCKAAALAARLEELNGLNEAMGRIADPPAVLTFTREVCRRRMKQVATAQANIHSVFGGTTEDINK